MAKTSAFGSMASGFAIGQKVGTNYDTDLMKVANAELNKIKTVEAAKNQALQTKYDGIMDQFKDVSNIPNVTPEERIELQGVLNAIGESTKASALELVKNPKSLEAQAAVNENFAKYNRIVQAQNTKVENREETIRIDKENDYSSGQDETELKHAKEIFANSAKRTFDDSGYETFVTDDGTTYDNNPNTSNPPPPKVESSFKNGHATIMASWNANVEANNDFGKITKALNGYNEEASAKTLYNDIMLSGPEKGAPTHAQKIDLFFGDISGDGQGVSFSDMFIGGKLDPSFYRDEQTPSGELEYNGVPISQIPVETKASNLNAMSDPSTAQSDSAPINRAQALEAILRDKKRSDGNLRNFTRVYASATKKGMEDRKKNMGLQKNTVLLDLYGMPDERFGDGGYFNTKEEAQAAKKEVYVGMKTDNAISSFMASTFDGEKISDNSLVKMFKNETGIKITPILNSEKTGVAGVSVFTSVDKYGKGTGKKLQFDLNNMNDIKEFKRVMMNNADMFKDLPTLGGDPRKWGIANTNAAVNTTPPNANDDGEGPKIDVSNEEADPTGAPPVSIIETAVSENNNMEQTSGQGSSFNFQNQGNFNFNSEE